MKWNQIQSDWKQVSDRIRVTWGKLSDADLVAIGGDRDELSRVIQKRYGYDREHAERMIDEFANELSSELETRDVVGSVSRTS